MGVAAADAQPQFHVLVVDDSLIDRKLIEKLLKTYSYQVTIVDSRSKALKLLGLLKEEEEEINLEFSSVSHHHHHDIQVNLIIMDYCMPGMIGYDLLGKIKKSAFLKDIPVIIMSSENVPSRISRCLEEGAEKFFFVSINQTNSRITESIPDFDEFDN